jgi:hypothetical protein
MFFFKFYEETAVRMMLIVCPNLLNQWEVLDIVRQNLIQKSKLFMEINEKP